MLDPNTPLAGKLEDLCLMDPAAFNHTHELVKAHLFSKYEGRRGYALKLLQKYWDSPVEVGSADQKGLIIACIRLSPENGWYFVAQYRKDDEVMESIPSDEEMGLWKH